MANKTQTAAKAQNEPTTERFDALAAHEYTVNGEKRTEWLPLSRRYRPVHDARPGGYCSL